jgi:hypothetical protein
MLHLGYTNFYSQLVSPMPRLSPLIDSTIFLQADCGAYLSTFSYKPENILPYAFG